MKKRGQISIFIIISLVIVVSVILFFFIGDFSRESKISKNVLPVHNFVKECIEKTSKDALVYVGDHGGYYEVPNDSLIIGIPLYFNKGYVKIPLKEDIEVQLSNYLDDMLFFCTKNFVDYPAYKVKQKEIKTSSKILNDRVLFDIKYPLDIEIDNETYFFENFEAEIPIRLNAIYNVSSEIVKYQKEFPEYSCISCYHRTAFENEVKIEMVRYQDSIVFAIFDNRTEINGKLYAYYFANRVEDEK